MIPLGRTVALLAFTALAGGLAPACAPVGTQATGLSDDSTYYGSGSYPRYGYGQSPSTWPRSQQSVPNSWYDRDDRRNDDGRRPHDTTRRELPDECLTRTPDGRYVYGARCLYRHDDTNSVRRDLPDSCMTRSPDGRYVYGARCLYRQGYKH